MLTSILFFSLDSSFLSNVTGGPEWTDNGNWNDLDTSSFLFGDWYGVNVNATGRVSALNLNNNNLVGDVRMTGAFAALQALEVLNLADNSMLSGTLPGDLVNLVHLQTLNIQNTGICTPDTQVFNEWLGGINFTGAECQISLQPPQPPEGSSQEDEGGGGCALLAPQEWAEYKYETGLLDLFLSVSFLLGISLKGRLKPKWQ